jgi:hypothetical protein
MPKVIEVSGLREAVRSAKQVGDTDLVDGLAAAWRQAERIAMARMQLRAAATGRRQDQRVAETLRPSAGKDRAAIRFGGATVPWWAGATFGAHHDRERRGPRRGTFTGFNQFPEVRPNGGWPYVGLEDARDEIVELVETELGRILDRALT